ncbi:MAG TPA: TonB-dependent receptor [Gemmatimonadaceae bacterium]|nr:TonB-dependent receptor [Gemmatimonadaceae bacterium]
MTAPPGPAPHARARLLPLGLSLVALAASGTAAAAQQAAPVPLGVVRGEVLAADGGGPLPRASVTVVPHAGGSARGTATDDRGRFRVLGVPAGAARVRVRLLGYRAADQEITVPAGDTARVTLRMEAAPLALGVVRIEARRERERFEDAPNVGTISLDMEALRRAPALAEADLLRSVQLLPGVVARSDYSAGYNVRGGESDQNLILLDGIPLYNPLHVGGLFGAFPEPVVGTVDLYAGAFPASYGGRLSSVLDVASRAEAREGVHGDVELSLLAATLNLGGALPDARTSWNVTGRRSYADFVAPAIADRLLPYYFYDTHAHVAHTLPGGASLTLTGYYGADSLEGTYTLSQDTVNLAAVSKQGWGNTAAGLTLQLPLGERSAFTQRAAVTRFATRLEEGAGARTFFNAVVERRLSGSLARQFTGHRVTAGYEYSRFHVQIREDAPQLTARRQSQNERPTAVAGFVDDVWRLRGGRLVAQPGVRFERVSSADWSGLSPRLSLKYFVTPDVAVTAAASSHAQWIQSLRIEDVPVRPFDYWVTADEQIPVATARHYTTGAEAWLSPVRYVRAEGFVKDYGRLSDPNASDDESVRGDEFLPMTGRSYGADVYLRQLEVASFSGWLAYTFTVAARTVGDLRFFASQDRRHSLNAVATYRMRSRVELGARFGYGSGTPYTEIVAGLVRRCVDPRTGQVLPCDTAEEPEPVGGRRNDRRFPAYHRLDLSASRTFVLPRATWTASLHLINAYNHPNVAAYTPDYRRTPPTQETLRQLPILPTVGLRVNW